jgi:hypothetical protein
MFLTLIIVFIVSYIAFSLSAICGGGAGLILLPVLGRILPVSQVPAALSIGTFTSSFSRIIAFKKDIRLDIVKWFVPAAIPAVWFGAWLLKFVNPLYLEVIMGLFLISNLPLLFKKPKEMKFEKKPHKYSLVIIGFLAGLLSGLTGAVGLLFNKFYLRYELTKEEIVATRAANEIIMHVFKIILYTLFGLISMKVIALGVTVAIAALLSTFTIKYILPLIKEILFKKVGYFAMVISGIVMLSQSSNSILTQNNGYISTTGISDGVEAKLKWQNANFAMELTYDEGFEFEQMISIEDLNKELKSKVLAQKNKADKIIIESVYSLSKVSYEAYYFEKNKLIKQLDLE